MKNIILLAPPASGKGTQASLLKNNFHYHHISTGDLLRNAASRNDDMGKKLNEIMSSGALVSDDIVIDLLKLELTNNENVPGFIFDGFPRNIKQADELDLLLKQLNMNIDYVFLLDASYDVLLKRITGRRTCKNCGKIYNIYNDSKPLIENICDDCGQILTKRSDDNEDSFKIRYQEYETKTFPLIKYYQETNKLFRIDALGSVDEIFKKISSIIERDV